MFAMAGPTLLATLFTAPMDIPTHWLSLLWALPISLSIAVVYKAVRLDEDKLGWRPFAVEVGLLLATVVGFLLLVAAVLLAITWLAWR